MPVLGLTGGIATGKSLVSTIFRELGATVIDCDVLAREVVAPGTDGLKAIAREFGPQTLTPGGALDRAALAEIVFPDPVKREKLEAMLHPIIEALVVSRSGQIVEKNPGAVVIVDAVKLFESGLHKRMDGSIAVVCSEETQLERAVARGDLDRRQIELRLAAQWPLEKKAEMADYVIDNSGTIEETRRQVLDIWGRILGEN